MNVRLNIGTNCQSQPRILLKRKLRNNFPEFNVMLGNTPLRCSSPGLQSRRRGFTASVCTQSCFLPARPWARSLPKYHCLGLKPAGTWQHLAAQQPGSRAFPWELTDVGFKIPHTVQVFEHKSQHTHNALKPITHLLQKAISQPSSGKKKHARSGLSFCVSCFKA